MRNQMEIQDESSQSKSNRRASLIETQRHKSRNDIFQDMIAESAEIKVQQELSMRNMYNRQTRRPSKKVDMKKILNSSSSNQRLPTSLKNDSSSLDHSDRARNVFQTQNSMDQQSFGKSFKKRYEESFSVQNTIRDSSSQFSQRSDSKGNQNNILPAIYRQDEGQKPKKEGCHCKRSKCLKLYCQCFQKRLYCNQNCNCHDCGNNQQSDKMVHQQAVNEALSRNPNGFEESNSHIRQNIEQNGFSLGVQKQQVRKGCKCKKTYCLKKYCECFQTGSHCGPFCRCEQCRNTVSFSQKYQ